MLIAFAVGVGIFVYRNAVMWTPLQRWYWDQYLSTQLMPMKANSPNGNYRLLAKVDRHGKQQLALDADVVSGPRQGRQLIPFTLSGQARQAGAADLVVDPVHYSGQQMAGGPGFDLAGTTNTVGAPLLRFLQGRVRCSRSSEILPFRWMLTSGHLHSSNPRGIGQWFPPLQTPQGWGTLSRDELNEKKGGPPAPHSCRMRPKKMPDRKTSSMRINELRLYQRRASSRQNSDRDARKIRVITIEIRLFMRSPSRL
ncbi:MAG TPA: hypothetical protein VMG31_11895, partial [Verrucomicrobiae bacterium]|nr:hypothetical protein [Verrucomicrobiae bacterium]